MIDSRLNLGRIENSPDDGMVKFFKARFQASVKSKRDRFVMKMKRERDAQSTFRS